MLAAIATGLGVAILTGEPSSDVVAGNTDASPTAVPSVAETPGSSAIPSLSPSPSGSTSAVPSASVTPSESASASENPTPRPGPTTTPQPTPPGAWVSSGNMIDERQGHTATLLDDGTLLVIGGYTDQLECAPTVERYDPRSDRWADETELPDGMRCPHSATLLDDGTVLVDGGPAAATSDASRASWRAVGDHVVVRFQPSSTLLEDGSVLVAGGWVGESEGRPTASVESCRPDHAPVVGRTGDDPTSCQSRGRPPQGRVGPRRGWVLVASHRHGGIGGNAGYRLTSLDAHFGHG